jgi:hypothetical protein
MAGIFSEKLNHDIDKFLATYKFLMPEAKAMFEGQLENSVRSEDLRTQKLYRALLAAAKEGLTREQTIAKMQEVENE